MVTLSMTLPRDDRQRITLWIQINWHLFGVEREGQVAAVASEVKLFSSPGHWVSSEIQRLVKRDITRTGKWSESKDSGHAAADVFTSN